MFIGAIMLFLMHKEGFGNDIKVGYIASPFVNGEVLFVDGGSSKDRRSQN